MLHVDQTVIIWIGIMLIQHVALANSQHDLLLCKLTSKVVFTADDIILWTYRPT